MFSIIEEWLLQEGLAEAWARPAASGIGLGIALAVSLLAYVVVRGPVLAILHRLARRTASAADDHLVEAQFFRRLVRLVPLLLLYALVPAVLPKYPAATGLLHSLLVILLTVFGFMAIDALLRAINAIYENTAAARELPIKGFLQAIEVVLVLVALILMTGALIGKSPVYLLSGLGALTAVLMLIFKDAILGFVAGIQLSANKMVARGDWISMPQYGADGFVIDVALTTVKIQNWDKTVTTIPTYALISESFSNWRGMFESGGRRIMRSISIDIGSIQLCTPEMLQRYAKIEHIRDYLERKQAEIKAYNAEHRVDDTCRVNGRRLTNIGTFRAYVTAYLKHHPDISDELTFLVRQLQPTVHGLPIQIYVFSRRTAWVEYEAIQADIFDHLLAVAPEFDLCIFQAPSGVDVRGLISDRSQAAPC